jgi:23S rRNA (pseudouridine1915-N3)-methyltransferase
MRLHFVWIGKTRERNCASLVGDYLDRIRRFVPVDLSELKSPAGITDENRGIAVGSDKLLSALGRNDFVILLDEHGREFSSEELAEFIAAKQQAGLKRLALVIGGAAGVSDEVKKRADLRLALSRMTLTHELARVILLEQIYRAFTLLGGFPYHRS